MSGFCDQIPQRQFLEYIEIVDCMKLRSIKISSFCLKSFLFIGYDTLDELKLCTPNLSIFKYHGDLISFSSTALALSEIALVFNPDNINNQWFVSLIEVLAKFNHSKVLNLQCSHEVCLFLPDPST